MKAALRVSAGVVALVIATLSVFGALQRPDTRLPSGAVGTQLVVAGTLIRYAQAGHGPDVLLLHGSPGSVEDWSPVFGRLADRYRVTAFDRPGHGYSGGAELPHTPDENARIALELMRALGLHDVVVVGHSYGGVSALALATRNPEPARAFVVVSSRGFGPVPVDGLYRLLAVPWLGAGLAAVVAPWTGPARIEAGIRRSFDPNLDRIPAGFVAERARLWSRPSVVTTLSQERATLGPALDVLASRYARIHRPVFLVYGENDTGNYPGARRLAAAIPGASLVTLPDTGHYVQYARPDELIGVIDRAAAGS